MISLTDYIVQWSATCASLNHMWLQLETRYCVQQSNEKANERIYQSLDSKMYLISLKSKLQGAYDKFYQKF